MIIRFADRKVRFQFWQPSHGRVFHKSFALDTETTLIDDERPWLTPAYVLGAACDGKQGYFIARGSVRGFLEHHEGVPMVMHNAAFDLSVLKHAAPAIDVYRWVERDIIWDTELLHRLYTLGSEGHVSEGRGLATLARCSERYLDVELPKDVEDARGRPVRLSYDQWLNRPVAEIEPVYLDYLGKDAMATYLVYRRLRKLSREMLDNSDSTWGYISPEWLEEQIKRWGPQTHHIQVKAAVVLREIEATGLHVDVARRDQLAEQVKTFVAEQATMLRSHGYIPGQKGSGKALQEILRRLEAQHREISFPRTPTNKYKSSQDALQELVGLEPFVDALLSYKELEKLQSTYLSKMGKRTLHPSFRTLKISGRTSSSGEINAQNLPRDERVRSCFVPPDGHVFIDADYSTVEMATLAQSVMSQLQIPSRMAETINAGTDLHRLVAAKVTGKRVQDVTKEERQQAKAINFGTPGGMGLQGLKSYAKVSYGVEMSDEEVAEFSEAWFDLFPEMKDFLADEVDLGLEIATLLNLTPASYFEHTGSRKFLNHPQNEGRGNDPHPILGGMCLKAIKVDHPETLDGRPYAPTDLDFFWTQLAAVVDVMPSEHRVAVLRRRPSVKLQQALMRQVGRAPAFTLTGRLRANATYCARHNTVFQGLAADGAKLGLWYVWRAGYLIANFIHDELLVAVPANSNLALHAETICYLMRKGMQAVVPDVRVDVDYVITDRWYKRAEKVMDKNGKLGVWKAA